jgi:hypothetical protein
MFRILRWTVLALALALLTAAAAPAAPVGPVRPALAAPGGEGLLAAAREWLARFQPATPPAHHSSKPAPPRKVRSCVDPDGHQLLCA